MNGRALIGGVAALALAAAVWGFSESSKLRAYGPGMMGGYGPGMMSGYGRGMMGALGYGMMHGPGGWPDQRPYRSTNALNLSIDDVKARFDRWIGWHGNARIKVGEVREKDADTIEVNIVTQEDSLVQRFLVDRRTGYYRPDGG